MPQLVATLIYLSQIYSYYIRGDIDPHNEWLTVNTILVLRISTATLIQHWVEAGAILVKCRTVHYEPSGKKLKLKSLAM